MPNRGSLLMLALLALAACDTAGGLRPTPDGSGPRVRYDLDARPFADLPFPNDAMTRRDPTSPTGRRLNVGTTGDTRLERRTREQMNALDGFGTFMPITVSFDALLDLDDLARRHRDNLDPADDAVFVVDLDPASPDYGRAVALDLGRGNYPATLQPGTEYQPFDPRQDSLSLLFETAEEDLDGDGVLDPGEDTDADGVLDHPNVWPPDAPVKDGLLTHYELQTNTLILRPLVPLRQATRYAVVLTNRLVDRDGRPVRSPFPYVNALDQTPELERLDGVFATWRERGIDLDLDDVAFAWTFTTQTETADLVAVREGLYGVGPFAWLADEFPPEPAPRQALNDDQPAPRAILDISYLKKMTAAVLVPAFGISAEQGQALSADFDHIDYVAQVELTSPDFLTDDTPDVWDWSFDLDRAAGTARVRPARILATVVVPKATGERRQPFPVAVYAHGFGQARVEALGFAGIVARYGIATVSIDAWDHGIYVKPEDRELLGKVAEGMGFAPFIDAFLEGRAKDLNGDGKIDAGGDTFSAFAFHTRDTLRQSVVDHLQLVRMLRGFDGIARWSVDQDGDGRSDLAGDFDADGVVDVGGPDGPYFQWGSSMGGLHTGILGALEPAIVAAAPVSGGGGLTQLTSRSQQGSVRTDTVMRALVPLMIAEPDPEAPGAVRFSFPYPLARRVVTMVAGSLPGLGPGTRLRLQNLDLDASAEGRLSADLRLALHVKANAGDRLVITALDEAGAEIARLDTWTTAVTYGLGSAPTYPAGAPLCAAADGWGLTRGSPDLRRLIGLAQMVLGPGDPITYMRHYFLEPLDVRPEGPRARNLLVLATLGDPMDPIDVHGTVVRAAGIVDYERDDPRYGRPVNDWLIENWVYEGVCGLDRFPPNDQGQEVLFDPDGLDQLVAPEGGDGNGFDAPGPPAGRELRQVVATPTGVSGVRFAHMKPCGKHSFFISDPSNPFNADAYLANLAADFFASGGTRILDDACLEDGSCPLPAR